MACACPHHHHFSSSSGASRLASCPASAARGLPSLALTPPRRAALLPPRPRLAPPPLRASAAASAAAAPTDAASAAALGAFAALPTQQQASTASTASAQARIPPTTSSFFPTATITRIFLTGTSPGGALRSALGGAANRGGNRSAAHGPLSLLLVLLALAAAAIAAVRNAVVRRVRGCGTCRGFGVCRCRLCQGSGRVDWTAKLSHYDVCPLCMNRRFVSCSDCGGAHGGRALFAHLRRRPGGELFEGVPRPRDEQAGEAAVAASGNGGSGIGGSGNGNGGAPLVSPNGTRGPVLAFGGAGFALGSALGSLSGSMSSMDGDASDGDVLARQPTGASSSRKRAQRIRDSAGGAAAFSVPADAAPRGIGSAMMD